MDTSRQTVRPCCVCSMDYRATLTSIVSGGTAATVRAADNGAFLPDAQRIHSTKLNLIVIYYKRIFYTHMTE